MLSKGEQAIIACEDRKRKARQELGLFLCGMGFVGIVLLSLNLVGH